MNSQTAKSSSLNVRLNAILDATPLCLNLWNSKHQNIMCNKAAVTLFDLQNPQEYLNRFFELSPEYQPDGSLSSEKAAAYIDEAFKTGRAQFEWLHQKIDGELLPAEITLVKIEDLDENGGDLVAGYTRDLRAQLKAEKLQQTINARIRAVLDSSPLSCILWDKDLTILDCNQVAVSMLGAENKSEVMQKFYSFFPPQQPDGEDSLIKRTRIFKEIFEKNNVIFEWVYLDKQKEEVPCEITVVKVPFEDDYIIVSYSRDLRELHRTLELNDRLSKMAYFDLLTGVSSRARFVEKLENNFQSAPEDTCFALILFDIDFFKSVNDTYGHGAGDVVLKRVAKSVEKMLPNDAILGRFGGDEFIIQIENINKMSLSDLMTQIVRNISDATFRFNNYEFKTSISMGASFKTAADTDFHGLLNRADQALYAAKEQGRCCSVIL